VNILTVIIWFVVPVVLAIALGIFLQDRKWFSSWALIGFGAGCRFLQVLFATEVLCIVCGKFMGLIALSFMANTLLMYSFLWYLRYTYTEPN